VVLECLNVKLGAVKSLILQIYIQKEVSLNSVEANILN